MPDDTTILSLPLILPAQAQKHVTHNEALAVLDLIVQLAVINRTLTTAPALPAIGDRHIVAAGAAGPWAGQSGRIALFSETGWQFTAPLLGWQAHVLAEGATAVFDGVAWKTPAEGPLIAMQLGVSATPDATNRLSVSSPATLLNHAGAGHQLKLNKAATADTASLLFQTGFSGRAELGTAGNDDFSVKVSANGAAFKTALVADAASGGVTLPQPVKLGGQVTDPGAPQDGTLWLNTTTGEVKVRSAGATLIVGAGGGGGGVADGDKGNITVSGGGTVWTIDAGAVTLAQMAAVATGTFLGRDTAGSGAPEVLSAPAARGILNVADGATANASDAALRDRATHSGTQTAATISNFDTAVAATPAVAANTAKVSNATHSGDVTGATALTIAADAVTNAKLADMASATIKGRTTAGTGDPEDLTAAQATALLDAFTSGAKGLVPASGGGTANFLRADGSWASPAGGGGSGNVVGPVAATDTALARFDGTTGKLLKNGSNLVSDAGEIGFPSVASPAAASPGGVNLFGTSVGGAIVPGFRSAAGGVQPLQSFLGHGQFGIWTPVTSTTVHSFGINPATVGTATNTGHSTGTRRVRLRRIDYRVTTANANAITHWRHNASTLSVGGAAAWEGGFHLVMHWGPSTGVATASATHRAFVGLRNNAAATDVNPSTLIDIAGMGWNSGNANIQFMHNDAAGAATMIDLGPAFPRPNVDGANTYLVEICSPPGPAQAVSYRILNLESGAVATGSATTDLPASSTLLTCGAYFSTGGTSSVIGMTMGQAMFRTEY